MEHKEHLRREEVAEQVFSDDRGYDDSTTLTTVFSMCVVTLNPSSPFYGEATTAGCTRFPLVDLLG